MAGLPPTNDSTNFLLREYLTDPDNGSWVGDNNGAPGCDTAFQLARNGADPFMGVAEISSIGFTQPTGPEPARVGPVRLVGAVLQCLKCAKNFSRADSLTRHLRSAACPATTNNNAPYGRHACELCDGGRSFSRRDHLLQHLRTYHKLGEAFLKKYMVRGKQAKAPEGGDVNSANGSANGSAVNGTIGGQYAEIDYMSMFVQDEEGEAYAM